MHRPSGDAHDFYTHLYEFRRLQNSMTDLQSNKEREIKVLNISSTGSGVGKLFLDGKELTVFVPGACPGDRVLCRSITQNGPVIEAELIRIISPGPHRVLPPCSYVSSCGGCSIQHVGYPQQLAEKQALVKRALFSVISDVEGILHPIIPGRQPFGSRTRGRFHVSSAEDGSKILGLHAAKSNCVIDIESCLAIDPRLDKALQWVRRNWLEEFPDGAQLHVVIDELKDRVLAAVSVPGDDSLAKYPPIELPEENPPAWLSLQIGERQEGAYLFPIKGDRPLRYAPEVFTQSDIVQNRVLVQEVLKAAAVSSKDTVLDLFCGIGNFSLPLARQAKRVEGVDGSRRSIELAVANAKKWECTNAVFFKGDGAYALKGLEKKGKRFDVVILDPPRVGVGKAIQMLDSIAKKRIVYISCNPKTLAKDLGFLKKFKPVMIQPLDMFPQTMHVETVVVLEPAKDQHSEPLFTISAL